MPFKAASYWRANKVAFDFDLINFKQRITTERKKVAKREREREREGEREREKESALAFNTHIPADALQQPDPF